MPDDSRPPIDERALVARYGPVARVFFLRRGLGHEAEDLAQQALMTTLEAARAGKVREPERIGAFVLGVCRNLARTEARSDGRRDAALARLAVTQDAVAQPVDPVMARFLVWRCLSALTARARDIVARTYVNDEDASTIAEAHDTTPGNVRVLRHRALGALLRCLETTEAPP